MVSQSDQPATPSATTAILLLQYRIRHGSSWVRLERITTLFTLCTPEARAHHPCPSRLLGNRSPRQGISLHSFIAPPPIFQKFRWAHEGQESSFQFLCGNVADTVLLRNSGSRQHGQPEAPGAARHVAWHDEMRVGGSGSNLVLAQMLTTEAENACSISPN